MRLFPIALLLCSALFGQGKEFILENYTKYEYRVPMRDGKRLFTSIYVPKDQSQKWPILMNRTPYSVAPYGPDQYKTALGPSTVLGKSKYIFVYQDVRGRNLSEGEFINMTPHKAAKGPKDVDESTDTYDTIDWLVKNLAGNNGKVCTYGISYPGFYTAAGMIDAHPAHVCASPQAPITDWFAGDDFHRNGALYLPHAFNFLYGFGKPRPEPVQQKGDPFVHGTPDGYQFFLKMGPLYNANEKFYKNAVPFWTEMMKHDVYDEFWQSRNLRPHLKAIKPAVMTVGGWFDTENLFGALQVFKSVEKASPSTQNLLVMGPWWHGQWARDAGEAIGKVKFNAKTGEYYREKIEAPFFEYHLKGKGKMELPKASVFETGTNVWRQFSQWPPKEAKPMRFAFNPGGVLSAAGTRDAGFEEWISDPAKPVPYIAGISNRMTREHMVDDQRFASSRTDVVVYQTEALEEDLTIAGPIKNELLFSTDGTDADLIVKLIDVYPDDLPENAGYQQLVRGEVFRGKFRESLAKPVPFVKDQPTKVEYELNDVLHTFRRGHRVMIHVQSSWFPIVDRNPQKFVNINEAKEGDFEKHRHRLHRGSGIQFLSLPSSSAQR
jgi:putative CocE/NonD family hydrolase